MKKVFLKLIGSDWFGLVRIGSDWFYWRVQSSRNCLRSSLPQAWGLCIDTSTWYAAFSVKSWNSNDTCTQFCNSCINNHCNFR